MKEKVRKWGFLVFIWVFNPSSVDGNTDPNDASALNTLFSSLNSPGQLNGWNASGGDPCGQSWKGITCSGSSITEIKLPGLGLSGTLAFNMDSMKSLVELDMSNNNLGNGAQIPYGLPPNLQRLNLASNQFGQSIPYSISQMSALQYLSLAHNQLQGNLTDMFGHLSNLKIIYGVRKQDEAFRA